MEKSSFAASERAVMARHTAHRRSWLVASATLVVALSLIAGCKSKQASQATPPTDQQLTANIQQKIQTEPVLSGKNILIHVSNGVVTLSGSVPDDASRALAAADTSQVPGVKVVVNDINVTPPQETEAAPQAEPARESRPESRPAPTRHERRSRPSQREQASQPPPPPPQQTESAPQQQQRPAYQPAMQAAAPQAPPPPVVHRVTLPAGTVVPVVLTEALSSKTAYANQTFHGTLARNVMSNGVVAIPRGTPVLGQVIDAQGGTHFKGRSHLSIDLTQVTVDGRKIGLQTDSFSKEGKARGKNTAEKAGGGALLGALIGGLAGGGKGAAIGAIAGGGAGAGVNAVTRGQEVELPSETRIDFHLQAPITLTVPNHRPSTPQNNEPQLQPRSNQQQ